MKLSLVQILVVVANIQVRILKAEVGKGFMRTAFDHELVDPKVEINLVNDLIGESKISFIKRLNPIPKGKKVNIPSPKNG